MSNRQCYAARVEGSHRQLRTRFAYGLRRDNTDCFAEFYGVARSAGVDINEKHIEIVVRQMLRKVKIENQGDTSMMPGEYVDIFAYEAENERTIENGGRPAF